MIPSGISSSELITSMGTHCQYLNSLFQIISPMFVNLHVHTMCKIIFVVQGDTLSEGYKICMEMCRFVQTICMLQITIVLQ